MVRTEKTPFQLLTEIDERSRELAGSSACPDLAQRSWGGIGFRLGDGYFVTPLGEIDEVILAPTLTPLPGVKPWVVGVANVRGRLLPVFDLVRFMGREHSGPAAQHRVLLVALGSIFVGLIVDEVTGLQYFPASSYSPGVVDEKQGVEPYVDGYFQGEHPWWVFRPFRLAGHPNFQAVAREKATG